MYEQLEFHLKIIKIKPVLFISSARKSHIRRKHKILCMVDGFIKQSRQVGPHTHTLIASKNTVFIRLLLKSVLLFLSGVTQKGRCDGETAPSHNC